MLSESDVGSCLMDTIQPRHNVSKAGAGATRLTNPRDVRLDAPIDANRHGGTGMLFTGTVGVNAVLVAPGRIGWAR